MKTYTETEALALRDAAVAEAARHATAAERARCLAAASRVGAFAACDEMLRDAHDAGETPPQAYGRGVAEGRRQEREACARLCEARADVFDGDARAVALDLASGRGGQPQEDAAAMTALSLRSLTAHSLAAAIRARAPQEPPQRPEAARDGATVAPDAPPPAGGLPVAAAGVCAACKGRGRVLCAREVEDGCDECEATGRVAMMVDATAATWCPRCDGSGRHLHEGWREVRCDECRTTGRVVAVASVAATRRCPACGGRGVRRYDDGTVDGCDACGLLGRVPAEAS